jgi:hypothetical protein
LALLLRRIMKMILLHFIVYPPNEIFDMELCRRNNLFMNILNGDDYSLYRYKIYPL